jgi:transposase
MNLYIGLDVSQRRTAICIIDEEGKTVAEGKALTSPAEIYSWIAKRADLAQVCQAGLEAGAMSFWLHTELAELGLPMICLEAFQAAQLLSTQRNKTDKNDARGLAQIVRMGGSFLKPVMMRSRANQQMRTLLTMRQYLVAQKIGIQNNITGTLKQFGLVTPAGAVCAKTFHERVAETLSRGEDLHSLVREAVMSLLEVHHSICAQLSMLSKKVEATARAHPVCKRLMTVPGIGPVVALSFVTAVDDPSRFKQISDVGAYFGLTPKQYQSGDIDIRGPASRRGDGMTRFHLIQAATVLLASTKKWCSLKAWGMKIAKRSGFGKAQVAVARKLSVLLSTMWIKGQEFRWTPEEKAQPVA